MAARDKIRNFFIANVGKVVTTARIRKVAGTSEYARRLRELRDQEGYQIKSHLDRPDLKPGQYILETFERKPAFGRGISPQTAQSGRGPKTRTTFVSYAQPATKANPT